MEKAFSIKPERDAKLRSLKTEEKFFGSIEQDIWDFKKKVATAFVGVFIFLNFVTVIAVVLLGFLEWSAFQEGQEVERLVTSEVVMAVLAATTAQLGVIMLTVTKSLFPT